MDLSNVLNLDLEATADRLAAGLRHAVGRTLKRRGLVVAISGGIDSACVAALAVRALGPARVFGLMLPEKDSSPESTRLGCALAAQLGIDHDVHDIAPMLEAAGCYRERDAAVQSVYPTFASADQWKIVMHGDRLGTNMLNVFYLVVRPEGSDKELRIRLTPQAYLKIVAATNFKQRARKVMEYYHADRLVYAVAGTPNRLEYDQGFFVKLGDGAADVKPIAGLYKTQVYALARHLGVRDDILNRAPTTDTYSLEQSQEDFYFSVPYQQLDVILWAKNHGIAVQPVADALALTAPQVDRVYRDIDQKRRTTAYLHARPVLLDAVDELALHAIDPHVTV